MVVIVVLVVVDVVTSETKVVAVQIGVVVVVTEPSDLTVIRTTNTILTPVFASISSSVSLPFFTYFLSRSQTLLSSVWKVRKREERKGQLERKRVNERKREQRSFQS